MCLHVSSLCQINTHILTRVMFILYYACFTQLHTTIQKWQLSVHAGCEAREDAVEDSRPRRARKSMQTEQFGCVSVENHVIKGTWLAPLIILTLRELGLTLLNYSILF